MKHSVYMGSTAEQWMENKNIKYITFNVTDDCNLACQYCYFTHKNSKSIMKFDTAKKAIDAILSNQEFDSFDGAVWDFIGGEPTLELNLIDQICDYILIRMYELNHKWLYCYRFLIGTNGLLYSNEKMQALIKKHGINLQVAMTIDGSKTKHDLSRIKKDGSGSYDDVARQVPLWLKQQGALSTKATFSHDDLPYLKESIINLWNLGIINVMANIVFEDVWEEGDAEIFKSQLIDLADYIVENDLWDKYSVRFFDPTIGMPLEENLLRKNFCGTGKMLAISTNGDYFPCVRFLDSALNKHSGLKIGSIDTGWDTDKLRAFKALDTITQSNEECLNCEIASGCHWCSGFNYDDSNCGTIFERKTYICKMHKANVEACRYLWKKFEEKKHELSPLRINYLSNTSKQHKFLYIIVNNHTLPSCNYTNTRLSDDLYTMDIKTIEKAIKFCDDNNYTPIFVGNTTNKYKKYGYTITDNPDDDLSSFGTCLIVSTDSLQNMSHTTIDNIILVEHSNTLLQVRDDILSILKNTAGNINITMIIDDLIDLPKSILSSYKEVLMNLANDILDFWKKGRIVQINVLTHILYFKSHNECLAGTKSLALSPDEKFYLCPSFYFNKDLSKACCIGNLDEGINNRFEHLCKMEKSKICNFCDANHCTKCIYVSRQKTNEFCVPPEVLCLKSNIEREVSRYFCDLLTKENLTENVDNLIKVPISELDPLLRI